MQHHRRGSDPDHTAVRQVARKIGFRVALLSAVMVIAGVLLLFSYLWVDDQQRRPHGPPGSSQSEHRGRGLDVKLDVDDLVQIAPLVGIAVIVLAGGGAMLFARQAVQPLEESMRRQRNFIGDASHELRTPLAVLDARIQQAQIMAGNDASLQPVLAELRTDSRVMADIVNDLLAAVSDAEVDFDPAQLATILHEVYAEMSVIAAHQGIELRVTGRAAADPGLCVGVPEIALRRSILALVDNALGHTQEGRPVTIEATVSGRWAIVRVIDEGRGITGIDPDQVFERFARGAQPAGSEARASHGIGLALVHDVATRHGGTVGVERTGATGTVMRLQVPIVKKK
ncbi:signal transduction histidine kinase [Leucobacter exalbidus]|uniref:histidine kinase n=1 Tax=Leucobacter exalbidus TaxID=662960 RepID=A0A940T3W6_9MICO|nr:HAMP domain-containing sensor histidine kinase [Leucobacter exalbidus]MBP1326597.1 signal transduction histidine kinase [Leucobacter exalbidus]